MALPRVILTRLLLESCYSCCLPALCLISSFWHSEHREKSQCIDTGHGLHYVCLNWKVRFAFPVAFIVCCTLYEAYWATNSELLYNIAKSFFSLITAYAKNRQNLHLQPTAAPTKHQRQPFSQTYGTYLPPCTRGLFTSVRSLKFLKSSARKLMSSLAFSELI